MPTPSRASTMAPARNRSAVMAATVRVAIDTIKRPRCTLNAGALESLRRLEGVAQELEQAAALYEDYKAGRVTIAASTPAPLERAG